MRPAGSKIEDCHIRPAVDVNCHRKNKVKTQDVKALAAFTKAGFLNVCSLTTVSIYRGHYIAERDEKSSDKQTEIFDSYRNLEL